MMKLNDLFGLQGRVALVTGGSRGIGKMIVEGLLEAGAERVYIVARKKEQVDETVAELGDKVIGLVGDLSQMDGIKQLADELASREDKLDLLVNNAGAAWGEPFAEFTEAGWDRTMDLNVKTPFFLTQKLYPLLKADPDIEHWSFYVGQGAIRFYLPLDAQLANDFFAQAVVVTKSHKVRENVVARLEKAFAKDFDALMARVTPLELGPPVGWPLKFRVSGPDPVKTRELAQSFAQVLGRNPNTRNINYDWNEPAKVINLMDALRKSIRTEQAAGKKPAKTKRGKKRIEGQREMLFSIAGKKPTKEAARKPARASGRRKAG